MPARNIVGICSGSHGKKVNLGEVLLFSLPHPTPVAAVMTCGLQTAEDQSAAASYAPMAAELCTDTFTGCGPLPKNSQSRTLRLSLVRSRQDAPPP